MLRAVGMAYLLQQGSVRCYHAVGDHVMHLGCLFEAQHCGVLAIGTLAGKMLVTPQALVAVVLFTHSIINPIVNLTYKVLHVRMCGCRRLAGLMLMALVSTHCYNVFYSTYSTPLFTQHTFAFMCKCAAAGVWQAGRRRLPLPAG